MSPENNRYGTLRCFLLALGMFLAFSDPAFAFCVPNQMTTGGILCRVYTNIIYADVGRGLATLAIVSLGIGALFGKVSWGMAVTVAVGIGAIFGAVPIYQALTGGVTNICC